MGTEYNYSYQKIYKKYVTDKGRTEFPHSCKLQFDRTLKKYYLIVADDVGRKNVRANREKITSLDPGEKIFQTVYSVNQICKIGDNMRIPILQIQKKIKRLQSVYDKNLNSQGKSIKNKGKLKKKIQKLENKIKGYVNEVHKKGAQFICENYENILLPKFETRPMLSKKKRAIRYEEINKLNDDDQKRVEKKKLNKEWKLSNEVKYVLSRESHYRFKMYLKSASERYGSQVVDVEEHYTSQTCTKCGTKSKGYNNREKKCSSCGYKIDRDINGSRNILIKCLREYVDRTKY